MDSRNSRDRRCDRDDNRNGHYDSRLGMAAQELGGFARPALSLSAGSLLFATFPFGARLRGRFQQPQQCGIEAPLVVIAHRAEDSMYIKRRAKGARIYAVVLPTHRAFR